MQANAKTVADIAGPWIGEASTGLLERCKVHWNVPIAQLSDLMIATFLSQGVATDEMLGEAKYRLASRPRDDTEHFDGQLEEAVRRADGS
ncbi:hypothetical protein [Rivibacter subsaxonicus]|uniref:hypothetical protein n=1 Tax=Rivibacter subsaxonicus TaxID=457575 RepID=UPI00102D21F4|nr:hypothetical protein [Rivibacter subsaxonicus]